MVDVFEAQVRQRAYEIWIDLGCADGQAHDHWIAAERDLMAQAAKPKKTRATAGKTKTVAPKTVKATAAKASAGTKKAKAAETSGAPA